MKNPALMTGEISELAEKEGLFQFHITSLRPLNPDNKADVFETKALLLFEKGEKEAFERGQHGEKVFRYMAPLFVEEACLKCHAKAGGGNGVKQGDLDLSMANPPHALDVHMSSTTLGGAGLNCVSCHTAANHKIAGKGSDIRVADTGSPAMKSCTTCHGSSPHDSGNLNEHISKSRADCTACHTA